eukprot:CAMPEP_0119310656 /NCGR_PEP_ID=MMETSP1333-20130426/19693_1 /TAXON_ID=418940 /ORGANISM="Scyphosphaera apsteinii, Strain RCC1455" /LENGTH=639 /DNA_ID=CAMNT_0007314875 /DNA_START=35 /DNA_END=1954 /DNA_ORIENTATION=-
MEVDGTEEICAEGGGEDEEDADDLGEVELGEFSLDIFDVIKSAQAQHGLRHGDYARYRLYCARRLHRLRKSLKFTHGKGRFVKRPLLPSVVRDARFLMLPLFCAERAWSYAMQLKRENTQQEPRPHYHLLSRLAKAAHWSAQLASLCAECGSKRTELEANAYASFMAGNMHLERENWAPALSAFKRCATISSELCRVSLADQAHLYREMVTEVEPSIRFCTYNLRRLGEEVEGAADDLGTPLGGAEELLSSEGGEGASDILLSKLEQVLQETQAKQAKDLNELELLGERVPIKNDKTRVAILRSRQLLLELGASLGEDGSGGVSQIGVADDAIMSLYDKLFVAFNDALDSARYDLRQASKDHTAKAGVAEAHLLKLQAALQWQKLHHTVRRTLLLVERHRLGDGSSGGGKSKRSSPEDLVRLYDSVITNLSEMMQLDGYKENEKLMGQVAARTACAKAYRCYYVAESYGSVEKWRESLALYNRAGRLMVDALQLHEEYQEREPSVDGADSGRGGSGEDEAALAQLEQLVEGAKARANAQAILGVLRGSSDVAEASATMGRIDLEGSAAPARLPLLQRLDHFTAADPEHIIAFPPMLATVPCKPLLFDIARNQIQFPDLSARLNKTKRTGGGWGSWFTGR